MTMEETHRKIDSGLTVLEAISAILAARILALLAVFGALGIWVWAAYDPLLLRIYAGLGVSLTVLVPCLLLYHRHRG